MEALLLSFCTFLSTSLGGLFGLRNRKYIHDIMSFTAGVVIAVCFFDILPEALGLNTANGMSVTPIMVALMFGFLSFHILEKTILIHHGHEEHYADHKHPAVGLAGALGLSFHSLLDGVGIGLGFHLNPHIGLLIATAVIAHDFSDGLNTVTFMLSHHNSPRRATWLLFLDAVTPIVGTLLTFAITISEKGLPLYLGFFAGFLLYIGASDLLPEAHSGKSSYRMIGLTILGALFIFLVTRFT